jgi:hypothetical protein
VKDSRFPQLKPLILENSSQNESHVISTSDKKTQEFFVTKIEEDAIFTACDSMTMKV